MGQVYVVYEDSGDYSEVAVICLTKEVAEAYIKKMPSSFCYSLADVTLLEQLPDKLGYEVAVDVDYTIEGVDFLGTEEVSESIRPTKRKLLSGQVVPEGSKAVTGTTRYGTFTHYEFPQFIVRVMAGDSEEAVKFARELVRGLRDDIARWEEALRMIGLEYRDGKYE